MNVNFPAYRRFEDVRIEANDSMAALLVGSRIASHTLKSGNALPETLLPDLFPKILEIKRVNRSIEDTRKLLNESGKHFAYMAIPYSLAVYESYLVDIAQILKKSNYTPKTLPELEDLESLSLKYGHEYISDCCGFKFNQSLLDLFHISRRIRNRIIHSSGSPGSHLLSDYKNLNDGTKSVWRELSGRPLEEVFTSNCLELDFNEVKATLAICQRLVFEINDLLIDTLSREQWALIAVEDYKKDNPIRFRQTDRRTKRIQGYAQHYYAPLKLTEEELGDAIKTAIQEN